MKPEWTSEEFGLLLASIAVAQVIAAEQAANAWSCYTVTQE